MGTFTGLVSVLNESVYILHAMRWEIRPSGKARQLMVPDALLLSFLLLSLIEVLLLNQNCFPHLLIYLFIRFTQLTLAFFQSLFFLWTQLLQLDY